MTDIEIRIWLRQLAKAPVAQKAVVRDLMYFAGEDRMSQEDRQVCHRALKLLELDQHIRSEKYFSNEAQELT